VADIGANLVFTFTPQFDSITEPKISESLPCLDSSPCSSAGDFFSDQSCFSCSDALSPTCNQDTSTNEWVCMMPICTEDICYLATRFFATTRPQSVDDGVRLTVDVRVSVETNTVLESNFDPTEDANYNVFHLPITTDYTERTMVSDIVGRASYTCTGTDCYFYTDAPQSLSSQFWPSDLLPLPAFIELPVVFNVTGSSSCEISQIYPEWKCAHTSEDLSCTPSDDNGEFCAVSPNLCRHRDNALVSVGPTMTEHHPYGDSGESEDYVRGLVQSHAPVDQFLHTLSTQPLLQRPIRAEGK